MDDNDVKAGMQSDFLRERIKQKPINRKKLLRRTIITAAMAVLFGIVASLTFLLLEPVINNWLYPEEEPQEVQFPEESPIDEMNPEDMLTEEMVEGESVPPELEEEQIEELLSQVTFGVEEYQTVYDELASMARDIGRSLVTVTGVTSDVDWFNNTYENEATASGIILADNGQELLMLVSMNNITDAERIVVTFCDRTQMEAELIQRDSATGLAILSVPLIKIAKETMDAIDMANLGSSAISNLAGTPVMALGSPMGTSGSVCYGFITSVGVTLDHADSTYRLMTTDIYASRNASGVLVNLKGNIIGIIDNSYNSEDKGNLLSAYGISELKRTITKMSNKQERAYLGIHGTDVPAEASLESGVPEGAYIKEIEMDSPAMTAGIQSGDVITMAGNVEITSYSELLNVLYSAEPENVISLTIMRQGMDGYQSMRVAVTLGTVE
ncbi:MAG: PDZ domain-containing protein [Lachnospiraceae bacterium]|nr:PDZ domain-containing protein [Lachnospiraceae bacterium]